MEQKGLKPNKNGKVGYSQALGGWRGICKSGYYWL